MSFKSGIWRENLLNAKDHAGTRDVLFITFDTLRYDVAIAAMDAGQTPFLKSLLPHGRWEARHTPGSFTYAAHHAFFAGFLPTPEIGDRHERLFAVNFPGSESTGARTLKFETADIISGYKELGYYSLCVGGVGFFNKLTPLGRVLPNMFDESEWRAEFGVADINSQTHQLAFIAQRLNEIDNAQRLFLFLNLSAMHQPNCHYLKNAKNDTPETQGAALAVVDKALKNAATAFKNRKWLCVFTSDHGTAYDDCGYHGHRLAHESVWRVPYAEFLWN